MENEMKISAAKRTQAALYKEQDGANYTDFALIKQKVTMLFFPNALIALRHCKKTFILGIVIHSHWDG